MSGYSIGALDLFRTSDSPANGKPRFHSVVLGFVSHLA